MSQESAPAPASLPVEGPANRFATPNVCAIIAREINDAGGVEVFFIGRRNKAGLVEEVEAKAYGNSHTVAAALTKDMRSGDVIIHNHPGGNLTPSDADVILSSNLSQYGVGSYVCDNDCHRMRIIVRPHDVAEKKKLEISDVTKYFTKDSKLNDQIDYEERPSQKQMAEMITDAFNNESIAVIEAGTGTGKSLAYLIPAILYAIENEERVIVSTNTINLQEQILHKDLPVVERVLGKRIHAEIVKGRSNYVCKRKAQAARDDLRSGQLHLIEDKFRTELRELLEWARESANGDRQELNVQPSMDAWERVVSESDNCLRLKCPFYEECFYYNSRRRASRAALLIVNHSLLLSDASIRREMQNWSASAVIPPSKFLVLDEAHHLEEVATRHLANQISRQTLRRLFRRFYRTDTHGSGGVLLSLKEKLEKYVEQEIYGASRAYELTVVKAMQRTQEVQDGTEFLIEDVGHVIMGMANIDLPNPGREEKFRLKPPFLKSKRWKDEVFPILSRIVRELTECVSINTQALEAVMEIERDQREELIHVIMEWKAMIGRLDEVRAAVQQTFETGTEYCRWVEFKVDKRRNLITKFCTSPIDVSKVLNEILHQHKDTEILTSATLTVGKKFDYFLERTGLNEKGISIKKEINPTEEEDSSDVYSARPVRTRNLPSPFKYNKQVFFAVPNDLGDVRNADFNKHFAKFVVQCIEASGGRAFILFTSFHQLNHVYNQISSVINSMGIECYKQGQQARTVLLDRFRRNETSVLFATSSFWEGVDVQGRALELLILAKLPFTVPNDPVAEAQNEYLEAQGRDPFANLTVPRAIVRFKQGFGRLIRSKTDRGAVIVCDQRIMTMSYGKRFLESLPEINVCHESSGKIADNLRKFLKNT